MNFRKHSPSVQELKKLVSLCCAEKAWLKLYPEDFEPFFQAKEVCLRHSPLLPVAMAPVWMRRVVEQLTAGGSVTHFLLYIGTLKQSLSLEALSDITTAAQGVMDGENISFVVGYSALKYGILERLSEDEVSLTVLAAVRPLDCRESAIGNGLSAFAIEDSASICYDYDGLGGDVVIPAGIMKIGRHAFSRCMDLTNVVIPEGVTEIGKHAFAYCLGLTSVTIPESVTKIGEYAFMECGNLTDVIIPKSIKNLNETRHPVFGDCPAALIAPHIPIENFHPRDTPGACHGFAKLFFEGAEMDGDIRAGYLKYIKSQRKTLYPEAIMREELLRLMLTEKLVPWADIYLLLEECYRQDNYTAKDTVVEYNRQNFPPVDWGRSRRRRHRKADDKRRYV